MSIETEFQSTIQNVQNAYNGLNNLGATIPQNKTIENIKSCLDEIYDNLPKTEYQEGTEVTLENCLKGKLDYENGVVGIGQSSQDGEPTPSSPIPIKCVTGNIEEVVGGKNLWGGFTEYTSSNGGIDFTFNANGSFKVKGTAIGNASISITNLVTNGIYKTLPAGTYTISKDSTDVQVQCYDENSTSLLSIAKTSTSGSFTIAEQTKVIIRPRVASGDEVDETILIQMEKNTEPTPYEPYITPISYQLSLGDIELCGIGDYKDELIYDVDEDKVYKNEKIGKVVLNGSENWTAQSEHSRFYISLTAGALMSERSGAKSNYYIYGNTETTNYTFFISSSNQLLIRNEDISGKDNFKTWLSTHNTDVIYVLNTPTLKEITDTTLKAQVKQWYNAHSNNGTTIIEGNGDLPMIIKCRALKGE